MLNTNTYNENENINSKIYLKDKHGKSWNFRI